MVEGSLEIFLWQWPVYFGLPLLHLEYITKYGPLQPAYQLTTPIIIVDKDNRHPASLFEFTDLVAGIEASERYYNKVVVGSSAMS